MYDSIDICNNAKKDFDGVPQQYFREGRTGGRQRSDRDRTGSPSESITMWVRIASPKTKEKGSSKGYPARGLEQCFFFGEMLQEIVKQMKPKKKDFEHAREEKLRKCAEIHVKGGNNILVTTGNVHSFALVYPDSFQLSPHV